MRGYLEVRGVRRRIALDGWWLGMTDSPGETGPCGSKGLSKITNAGRGRWRQGLLIVLIADFLFWEQRIGLSLAMFALGLMLIAGWGKPRPTQVRAMVICLLGALPVVDHVQPLSLLFLALGLVAAISTLQGRVEGLPRLAARMAGFLLGLPGQWLRCLAPKNLQMTAPLHCLMSPGRRAFLLRDWAFPLAGSLIFLALLLDANPIFLTLGAEYIDLWRMCQRGLFWAGVVVMTTPFLLPAGAEARLPDLSALCLPKLGLNMRSVLRALVMFNALICVQMVSDLAILIGGADLPGGMSYAEYAHRGAYPLLATAMLAMAFAILARPFWHEHRLIRPLMLLWLVQNIVLTGAAALRLDLYVQAYGLTYLRLYALIWMGLVALALGLSILQMALDRSTAWLVLRAAGLGLAMLYGCAFINFAAIIAVQNLSRPNPDLAYVCALGPMAAAAMPDPGSLPIYSQGANTCEARTFPRIDGWRDWGFRRWRVDLMVLVKMMERAD